VRKKCDELSHMKTGIAICHVTEETAQSVIIIVTIIQLLLLLLSLSSSSSSLQTRSPILSKHQHAVNDRCFFLRDLLYV
jgi:hypothetical protein